MWLDQFEFAGFYVAKEKGFYEKAGIDVELKKFDNSINVLNEVMENKADFGVNSTSLIIEKSNGKDIVLLGSIFQSSPLVLLALKNSNIKTLKDVENKKMMITPEQSDFASFQAMLISENISFKNIEMQKHSFNVDDLINKNTDLMVSYTTNEPFVLKEKGYESIYFHPKDYGFDFYEEFIFTSKEFANKNPKLVKDFYDATILGWEYAFNNIDEIAKLIYEKYNPQNKSLDSLIFEANEMKKLVYDQNGKIGTITKEKLNLIINSYKVMGLMKKPINVDDLVYTKHLGDSFFLNEEEVEYLHNKGPLKICVSPNWLPFEKIKDDKYLGIAADYINLINEKLQTKIKLVQSKSWYETLENGKNGICDIIPMIIKTKDRTEYFDFTSPYINLPLIMAGGIEAGFIEDINQLKDKKIGISKGYAFERILRENYKNLILVEVKNIHEGLEEIQKGTLFGYVGNLATVGFAIQENYIGQIKIIAKLEESLHGSIGSRKDEPLLHNILQKALDSINKTQREEIYNKWIYVNYQKEVSYVLFNKITIGILLLLVLFTLIYRQYLLKKMNKQLHEKIKIEMQKNEEKNRISIQQSRMASMGEMIENIAHQWRQPLSTISVLASGMEVKKELGILSDEDIISSIKHIKNTTQYLSNTIEDFRSFFSKDKISSNLDIKNTIKKALDLVNATFITNQITVEQDVQSIIFSSYENELIQVLMNILMNAKDALEHKESEKLILIKVKKVKEKISISIRDNAGGVPEDIIDKIFEPYFTTKHQFNGTGIGLYMSKLIVEKHLDGELNVKNISYSFKNKIHKGALFKIILPIKGV